MKKPPTDLGVISTGKGIAALEEELTSMYGVGVIHVFDKVILLAKVLGVTESSFRVEEGCLVMLPMAEKDNVEKCFAIFDLISGTAIYDATKSIPGATYEWVDYVKFAQERGNCGQCSKTHFPGFTESNEKIAEKASPSSQEASPEGAQIINLRDAKKKPPTFH